MNFDSPCVHVDWRVAHIGRLSVMMLRSTLIEEDLLPPSINSSLGESVGIHSINLVDSGLIIKLFRRLVDPGLLKLSHICQLPGLYFSR